MGPVQDNQMIHPLYRIDFILHNRDSECSGFHAWTKDRVASGLKISKDHM